MITLPEGSTGKDLAEKLHLTDPSQALAMKVDGQLVDLSTPLHDQQEVLFLSFADKEGEEIFWHTSAHVLAQAILRLYPQAKPTIGPPIDKGFYYDFADLQISDEDLVSIENEIEAILKENYISERHLLPTKKEALHRFKNNPYKQEIIKDLPEGEPITAYSQGEFFDLCRGPHLPNLGKIKAFKLLKVSGAYWRGDSTREMLTRIYGISYPDRKQLKEYITFLEEAKKRDHKILGPKLGLFSLMPQAPGMPFIHPKGMIVWNRLLHFWRELHVKAGYQEMKTPQILSQDLWETSGHWSHYRENMYAFSIEDRHYAIKPMNCPGTMLYYKSTLHSYRDLPLRLAEIGHVHRHEASGALSGLFRVRSFHQDDAHLFTKRDDITREVLSIFVLVEEIYQTFHLPYRFELSTRPKESMGTDEDWAFTTQSLKEALDAYGAPYQINEGDGAFYGPKIDIHIRDVLHRSWQCGTIQLDMSLPEKFALEYTDSDGQMKRPILIHRAIFGSVERFFGILIEHFAGRFPLWISPNPIRVITIADRHIAYAREVQEIIKQAGFLVDIDDSHESINKKIRNAQLQQINYMLTLGDKEMEERSISLRTREGTQLRVTLDQFLAMIAKEQQERALTSPFNGS